MEKERIYLYPVYIRLWHLINALLILSLIITGISMQFSNPKFPLIRFNIAVTVHNVVGILLSLNYLWFLFGNIFSGNGKYYKIRRKGLFTDLKIQFIYYTKGIFQKRYAPFQINRERKFNPLQQFSYLLIMYFFVPVIIISGIAMLYPEIFIPARILGISPLHFTDLLHITAGFVISLFMFVHIYFCTFGTTPVSTFTSMINGYHEAHD